MIGNYLKIAFRNLFRQRNYTVINIVGLTIGIAAFLMIMLYVQHEISFDSHIPDMDRLYRCVEIQHPAGIDDQHVAVTMGPLGPALVKDFPEIEKAARLMFVSTIPLGTKDFQFNQPFVAFADTPVFDLFGVKLIKGDTATALKEPMSIVLSEKVAKKLFGSVEEAYQKVITVYGQSGIKVSGIMENCPRNAHFRYEALVSYPTAELYFPSLRGWGSNSLATYVRLNENADVDKLSQKFRDFIIRRAEIEEEDQDDMFELYLQPVSKIHLHSGHIKFQVLNYRQGNNSVVSIFIIIAILIVLIACINYINIAIARSMKRAREVGMRKVLGANRKSLVSRFLGESFILTLISIIFAVGLVELLLPSFNDILRTNLDVSLINNWIFNIGLLALLILIGLVSGSYPAFYLSRYRPITVLKGSTGEFNGKSGYLSKGLVVFQFVISIALIFSILVMYRQMNYLMNKDLGYNYDKVLTINMYNNNTVEDAEKLENKINQNPNVIGISASANYNGVGGSQSTIHVDDTLDTEIMVRIGYVDYDYFPLMDIDFVEGRNFSKEYALDEDEAIIINEATAEALGWQNPLGKRFQPMYTDTVHYKTVIGVINNYHYYSLHERIEPAVYFIGDECNTLNIKISGNETDKTLEFIESSWNEIFPGSPYEANFADFLIESRYSNEKNSVSLFGYFTILSIIISALGLYGLTTFIIQQRTREIGIRKVMGSSVKQVVMLLMSNFLLLVGIAALIALPLAWYFMREVLNNFAYRINISWYYFITAILVSIIIAVLTILYQAYRAATANPVDSIKYE